MQIPGNSARVLSIHAKQGIPQVISTDRHISQGGVDLEDVSWSVVVLAMNQGILLVDETRNGTGAPGSPSDEQVDEFYHNILTGYSLTDWDIDSQGSPGVLDLGRHSLVIWHGDDYANHRLRPVLPEMSLYLKAGGKLWLSGWRPIMAIMGTGTYPFTFGEGDFPYDYLKLQDADESTSNDFTSAWGGPAISAYPDISVDSTKVPLSWSGKMKYIDVFTPLDAEPIYFFNSASGDTSFQDKPCGIRYLDGPYKIVFLGFPLYFMREDEATLLAQKVLGDLQVGVEETTPIPKVFALLQNYPNPFRGETDIRFQIPDCSEVSLKIYDITGRLVRTLVDEHRLPGYYAVTWDGRDERGQKIPCGIYLCKLGSAENTSTKKLIFIR